MFGLGLSEILLILGIGLIFIGPERLPDLARSLARGYAEFRRSFDDMKSNLEKDIRAIDTENLLQKGKAFPLEDFKKSIWEEGETKLPPPPAASSPYPVEAEVEAQSEAQLPSQPSRQELRQADARAAGFPDARTEFRSLLKSELKYELKAELMAELKAELAAVRQAESTHES